MWNLFKKKAEEVRTYLDFLNSMNHRLEHEQLKQIFKASPLFACYETKGEGVIGFRLYPETPILWYKLTDEQFEHVIAVQKVMAKKHAERQEEGFKASF